MKKGIVLLITGIVLSGIAQAETLALWDGWENNMTTSPQAPTALFAGVNSGTLGLNNLSPYTGGAYTDMFAVGGQEVGLAATIANNEYMTIVVDLDEGMIMNLTSLNLWLESTVLADGAEKEQRIVVFSSVDGWTSGDEIATYSFLNGATEKQQVSIDLTGGSYDGLSTVEFRLMGYRVNDSSNMWNAWGIGHVGGVAADQNIVLNGIVDSVAQGGTMFQLK